MTTIKRFSLPLVFTLLALALSAHAQTPSIEVSTDNEAAEFSAQGGTNRMHVEVFAPSGELVFETDEFGGQSIRWGMVNQRGERVPDGLYLAAVTVVDSYGKQRKRIEQLTVSSPQPSSPSASAPQGALDPTGSGSAGKIAKWTNASTLGNSVITESVGKVGVNVVPQAMLHVNNPAQPPSTAGSGTAAASLLQTSGGKGGNTTGTSGQVGGTGASISLLAGQGGNAPSGSTNGAGGSITLQPGSAGIGGGFGGASGNVLLAPLGVGRVGVGTSSPVQLLHIKHASANAAALVEAPTGRFAQLQVKSGISSPWIIGTQDNFDGNGLLFRYLNDVMVIRPDGKVGLGTPAPATRLHVAGDLTLDNGINPHVYLASGNVDDNRFLEVRFSPSNPINSGIWVSGIAISHDGSFSAPEKDNLQVRGRAVIGSRDTLPGVGLYVVGSSAGVQAETTSGYGLIGAGPSGIYGRRTSSSGYAGYFDGPVQVNGLVCAANIGCPSDARLKQNITNLSYGLNQLLRLRPVSWRWKSEPRGNLQMGLVAQEVEKVIPEVVLREADATKPLALNYMALLPVAVKAIQEQQAQILEQQKHIERLEAQLKQVRRAVRRRAGGR